MKLVILAAGKGQRLGAHAGDSPKSLVAIAGEPYLAWQFSAFARFSFQQKIIVTGYAADKLLSFLSTGNHQDWLAVNNPNFHKGNLYSLAVALPQLEGDGFFIFNADHFYSPKTYAKIFSQEPKDIVVFIDRDRPLGDDDMKAELNADASLLRMAKTLTQWQAGYVGVTWVPAHRFMAYQAAFAATADHLGESANVEAVLNELAQKGERIQAVDLSGSWWTEIDTPEDLERARQTIEKHKKDLHDTTSNR